MQLQYANNPMYALCLLAAVCVRQHVQNGIVQPLTKGRLQHPTPVLTKPNKTSLQTFNNSNEIPRIKLKSAKYPRLEDANALVLCVQNFTKKAEETSNHTQLDIPSHMKLEDNNSNYYGVPSWILHLLSNLGVKWFA